MGESMSKGKEVVNRERLLLEEIDKYSRIYGECLPANLADTLQEVLSQPEQEPVYWGNEKKALLNEIDHLTNRLAQPELSTDSLQLDEQEPVAWITEWVEKQVSSSIWSDQTKRALSFTREGAMAVPNPNYIPLYISPPKREQPVITQREEYQRGYTQAEIDLKRKPIFNYTAPDYITGEYLEAYDLGFSDAEKAHDITGVVDDE